MKKNQKNGILGIICIFMLIFFTFSYMQEKSYKKSDLMNKEWVNRIPGKTAHASYSYTDKEITLKVFYNGVKIDQELVIPYYLSDDIVDKFHADSVGNNKSGKYIVRLSKIKVGETYEEHIELFEILELTDTFLKTKHVRSGTVLEFHVEESENQ